MSEGFFGICQFRMSEVLPGEAEGQVYETAKKILNECEPERVGKTSQLPPLAPQFTTVPVEFQITPASSLTKILFLL
jgi:hypothetical protein